MGRHHGKFDRLRFDPKVTDLVLVGIESGFYNQATQDVIHLVDGGLQQLNSEVWESVRARWKSFTSNADEAVTHIHDDYTGWFISDSAVDDYSGP